MQDFVHQQYDTNSRDEQTSYLCCESRVQGLVIRVREQLRMELCNVCYFCVSVGLKRHFGTKYSDRHIF